MFRGIQIEKSDGVQSCLGKLSLHFTAVTQPLSFKIAYYIFTI